VQLNSVIVGPVEQTGVIASEEIFWARRIIAAAAPIKAALIID